MTHRVLALVGCLAAACTGTIDEGAIDEGPRPSGGTGPTAGGTGPSGADKGGLIDGTPSMPGAPAAKSCVAGPLAVTPRLVRLTRSQYENSVRDLTGLDVRPARDLPQDTTVLGYNRSLNLEVGDLVGRVFGEQANSLARQVVASPAAMQRVVSCDPKTGDACMSTFIADFGRRVFRRPMTDAEKMRYTNLFKAANGFIQQGDAFTRGVQATVEAMLQSPNFLYRFESSNKRDSGQIALSSHEIAQRLSFMLVNSTPDAALSQAADRNELVDPAAVVTHARRLLDTAAGKAMIHDFFGQWMDTGEWGAHLDKSTMLYPTWKPAILATLTKELELYSDAVTFERKKGLPSLLTSTFTYVNKSTAPFYGVQGTFTDTLQKVDLDPNRRAGILTQIGFLAANASAVTSSPIHRGVFVQRALLCVNIPPPGQQVPPLPPSGAGKTTREVVTEHTAGEGCRQCHHTLINPVGFGLENLDAVGAWRDTEAGKPVDASGSLVGTEKNLPFSTPPQMAKAIADSPESRGCYAKQWLRYSFGRSESDGDTCALDVVAQALANDSYTPNELLVDMVRSRAFMYRSAEGL